MPRSFDGLPGVHLCVLAASLASGASDSATRVQAVALPEYCPALNKALLQNLTHQQQKIRVAALQALGAIVPLSTCDIGRYKKLYKKHLDRS